MDVTVTQQKSVVSGELREKLVASKLDLFFLGITIVIGGQYFSWNEGLEYGFIPYLSSVLLMSAGYMVLIFSLAEMTSTLPFSGGSYGFVRVAMGPYFGFVVGYCEAILNIMYVTSSVIPFGEMMTIVTSLSSAYEPLYWLLFFATSLCIHARRGRMFWGVNAAIAIVSIIILVLYVLSTLQYVDINKYAYKKNDSTGNQMVAAFAGLPLSSWFYVGVEMLPLAAFESNRPRRDVPLAMTLCMLFLFCSAVAMLFTVSCQYPGVDELSGALLPLNYGFRRAFGISYQSATWLTLPAVYGTAFGFMYDYSRQLTAMSKSGLMPIKVPCQGRFPDAVLYTYLFLGSGLAIVLMLLVYYLHLLTIRDLFLICILGGYLVYVCVLISYIIFQTRYSTLHREFRSPFGITGAVVGIVIFCISIFSAVALQKNTTASVFLTVVLAVVSMHYYIYARHHQKFSDDEQKTLFSAYIINANIRTKAKNRKARVSDLSGQIRSFVLVRITSRNSNSSHNSSQAGTFRRAPGGVDRKNTGTETLTSVASTLESLKLNSEQQAVPSILECNSQDADLTPKKLVLKSLEQSHSEFEESYSIDRFKEDTQNLFHVKSSRAFRDVELDNAKCPVHINGKRVHPHSLRANAYLGSSSNEQNGRADPLNLSRKPVKRGSSLRRSLGKVVDTIHIISSMAKVLPIIDDEEFNQIADKTFVTHDMIGYEARQRGVCVESFSESSPLSLLS